MHGGGMSHAQVCRDNHLDRLVLVKELQAGVEPRRLNDEIVALASIRSKHVVQLYDVITDAGGNIVGLVEEYLPGQDLNAILPVGDPAQVMRIAYAMACGISDIHQAGRIHRDIKPANMKFDAEGCLKIFDFGLARSEAVDAATQGWVGTEGYMAPEIRVVDPAAAVPFSQAVDAYAFAATLLKVIRGTVPVGLRRMMPVLDAESEFAAQAVQLGTDLSALLNRCLAPRPGDRPAMSEVRDLLGAHILRDQHRAQLVARGGQYTMDQSRRAARIALGQLGTLQLGYDGLHFRIVAATGDVFVNNVAVTPPHILPGSCVITVGGPQYGAQRAHIAVDVSHPEVVL
jgi:serine/threonine-protein kinase